MATPAQPLWWLDETSSSGGGRAVVAEREIPSGTTILTERALLFVHLPTGEREVRSRTRSGNHDQHDQSREEVVATFFDSDPANIVVSTCFINKRFLAQYPRPANRAQVRRRIAGLYAGGHNDFRLFWRVATNSFQDLHHRECPLAVVYENLSMVNHSCQPNTMVTIDGRQTDVYTVRLKAIKKIQADEEIKINYLWDRPSTDRDLIERRERIQFTWGSDCDCPQHVDLKERGK